MAAKILHIFLLVSVLSSSTGIVLGKHHCQRMEQSEKNNMTSCADMGGCKKGCCTKTAQYFHLDQDQQIPQVDLYLPKCPSSFTVEPNWVYQTDIENLRWSNSFTFIPPIVKPDISVLFQVFRC